MTLDGPPTEDRRRRFACRRVRGYLVLGPIPSSRRWLPATIRLTLALMLPFWIYTPALAIGLFAMDAVSDEAIVFPFLFSAAAVSIAAGLYPLATWPCRWPFRVAATVAWAAALGAIAFPWTMLVAEYLG